MCTNVQCRENRASFKGISVCLSVLMLIQNNAVRCVMPNNVVGIIYLIAAKKSWMYKRMNVIPIAANPSDVLGPLPKLF